MDTINKPRTQKATRPASKWRNRWLTLCDYAWRDVGFRPAGKEYWGTKLWPSHDAAETEAQEEVTGKGHLVKYVGAFPVEE